MLIAMTSPVWAIYLKHGEAASPQEVVRVAAATDAEGPAALLVVGRQGLMPAPDLCAERSTSLEQWEFLGFTCGDTPYHDDKPSERWRIAAQSAARKRWLQAEKDRVYAEAERQLVPTGTDGAAPQSIMPGGKRK